MGLAAATLFSFGVALFSLCACWIADAVPFVADGGVAAGCQVPVTRGGA